MGFKWFDGLKFIHYISYEVFVINLWLEDTEMSFPMNNDKYGVPILLFRKQSLEVIMN